jgi:hypothetical protein
MQMIRISRSKLMPQEYKMAKKKNPASGQTVNGVL